MKAHSLRPQRSDKFNYTKFEYKGKVYRNYNELAEDYNVPIERLRNRIKSGMTMSQAVSQKSFRDKPVTDETGRKFKSISEMADFYGIKRRTLTWRLNLTLGAN